MIRLAASKTRQADLCDRERDRDRRRHAPHRLARCHGRRSRAMPGRRIDVRSYVTSVAARQLRVDPGLWPAFRTGASRSRHLRPHRSRALGTSPVSFVAAEALEERSMSPASSVLSSLFDLTGRGGARDGWIARAGPADRECSGSSARRSRWSHARRGARRGRRATEGSGRSGVSKSSELVQQILGILCDPLKTFHLSIFCFQILVFIQ